MGEGRIVDERIVDFIRGLRARGVPVSLAEGQDALEAIKFIGISDRKSFYSAMQTALVKARRDQAVFAELFPLYFGSDAPPLAPISEGLGEGQARKLREALSALAEDLEDLLEQLLAGKPFDQEQLEQAAHQSPFHYRGSAGHSDFLESRMAEELGLEGILERIQELLNRLSQLGISEEILEQLEALLQGNLKGLRHQIQDFVNAGVRSQLNASPPPSPRDLMEQPFRALSPHQVDLLRGEISRLAARLRTRAAIRQKRGKGPRLDPKTTIRANLRHGGVPFHLITRKRKKKARFTLICDVSTSMRPVVEFLLLLMYHIQGTTGRTRSFAFIDHLEEISVAFDNLPPEEAVPTVLYRLPPGHYNTDLGASLMQFQRDYLDALDLRTTLILCGDGRNNYNPPRVEILEALGRRSSRTLWFNPEPPSQWGSGDSDMPAYLDCLDGVYQVANLQQLTRAIDDIL